MQKPFLTKESLLKQGNYLAVDKERTVISGVAVS